MNKTESNVLTIKQDYSFEINGKINSKLKINPWEISSYFQDLEKVKLHNCMEKMTSMEADLCLFQVHNSLRKGCNIEIITLDMDYFASMWMRAKWDGKPLKDPNSEAQKSLSALNGAQEKGNPLNKNYDNNYNYVNKSSYNKERLVLLLGRCGFDQIKISSGVSGSLKAVAKKTMTAGERQIAPNLSLIRKDHISRYSFATELIKPNEKILDFACGIGYGSFLIAESSISAEITACDISMEALDYARKNFKRSNIDYQQNDCDKPTLPANYFDTVVSFETIEHLKNPKKFICSLFKCLRPGGKIFISCPNQDIEPFDRKKYRFHFKHYKESEIRKILVDSGFENILFYSQKNSRNYKVKKGPNGKYMITTASKAKKQ